MRRFLFVLTAIANCFLISTTVSAVEKTITAKVKSVDTAKNSITLDDLELDVTRKTKITVDGKKATLKDVKSGHQAKVEYDDGLEAAITITVRKDSQNIDSELAFITEVNPSTGFWLTEDGLTMYGDKQGGEIWVAHRKTAEDRFVDETSLLIKGRQPTISQDELELIFLSDRSDGKKGESLHSAKRDSRDKPFRRPVEIKEFFDKSGDTSYKNHSLSPDGLALFYNSNKKDSHLLQFSSRSSTKDRWSNPKDLVGPTKPDAMLSWPLLTSDGCHLLCFEAANTPEKNRLVILHRRAITDLFTNPEVISIPGIETVAGRCPRYVAATKELFFFRYVIEPNGFRLSCITNFEPFPNAGGK